MLPRGTRAAVCFALIAVLLDVVTMGIAIPVLPTFIESLSGSNARAGLINGGLVALCGAMQFIAAPIAGSLSDRFGRRPIILGSSVLLAVSYALLAVAPSLGWIAVARLIAGAASSTVATVYAYVTDTTPEELRTQVYGYIGAAFSAGFVAGPLLGGLIGSIDPRAPFWFAAVISTLASAYGFWVLPESLPRTRRRVFSWIQSNPLGALRCLGSDYQLSRLAAIYFLLYFVGYVFSTVFVLYATHRFGWNVWQIGALFATAGLLDIFVQVVWVGPSARCLGERRTLVFGLLSGSFGIALMGLARSDWLFALAVLPIALRSLAVPTLQSLMTRRMPASQQGQLQGANLSLASLAGVFAPPLFGWIYASTMTRTAADSIYSGVAMESAALVLLAAALLGWMVAHKVDPNFRLNQRWLQWIYRINRRELVANKR